jgi:hypothetical protein
VTQRGRSREIVGWAIALAPLLFVAEPIRHMIESRMPAHMLLQFPMLIASGWTTAEVQTIERSLWWKRFDTINAHGLLAITLGSCVLALWMIPTALDFSLLSDPVRWSKYASFWVAGLLLNRSRRQVSEELGMLFVGSLAWMLATVGFIYQSMPQRLCVSYRLDEQYWTGIGLVGIAYVVVAAWLYRIALGHHRRARSHP